MTTLKEKAYNFICYMESWCYCHPCDTCWAKMPLLVKEQMQIRHVIKYNFKFLKDARMLIKHLTVTFGWNY